MALSNGTIQIIKLSVFAAAFAILVGIEAKYAGESDNETYIVQFQANHPDMKGFCLFLSYCAGNLPNILTVIIYCAK